jgi:hypothetical protein
MFLIVITTILPKVEGNTSVKKHFRHILAQKLQEKIERLVSTQNRLRETWKEPCDKWRRDEIESSLRRHIKAEQKLRKQLAALTNSDSPMECALERHTSLRQDE